MTMFRPFAAALLGVSLVLPAAAQRAAGPSPDDFKIEVEVQRLPVLSQGRTGTCWAFATTSFLESEIERLHGEEVDLSEIHTVYWGYVEKAMRFVRLHGKAQFSQGGLSHDVIAMARRHGVVPNSAYSGLKNGGEHDHSALEKALTDALQPFANGRGSAAEVEAAVRAILDQHLGAPPETFEAKGVNVTPEKYAKDILRLPLDDYIELMSFQSEGFDHTAELLVPDNWMRYQGYWNVPVDELLANIDHAVRAGYSVALDCDVSERTNTGGMMKLSNQLEAAPITDELRQQMFDERKTTDDHLMHIVGIAKGPNDSTWYVVKNSWGNNGPFGGNVMMSRAYVAAKTLAVMIHRDGLVADTRAKFETGPQHAKPAAAGR